MDQDHRSDIYIGLMSGTSLDGIDIAIVDFSDPTPKTLHAETIAYSDELRRQLRDLTQSQTATLDELYGLEAILSQLYAELVSNALAACDLSREQIAALGCHGQTIRHRPDASPAYTAQLVDPGRLAVLTGITTVADFRRKDVALGGQGAPLAPAFHQFLFRSQQENRVIINIGGIANVTCLPADSGLDVTGFDTGPGNTLLDHWIQQHQNQNFDDDGVWARSGQVIAPLLEQILADETYFSAEPPKSTGTEYFTPDWLSQWLDPAFSANDVQTTLVELTASTIAKAITALSTEVNSCFVCGGGTHNDFLLERISAGLPETNLQSVSTLGIDPDYVEASAFAWLARARLLLQPSSLPSVTAASRYTTLGGVYLAD